MHRSIAIITTGLALELRRVGQAQRVHEKGLHLAARGGAVVVVLVHEQRRAAEAVHELGVVRARPATFSGV